MENVIMGAMGNGQKEAFQERLARIQRGGEGTMGEVLVGPPDEAELLDPKNRKGRKRKKKKHVSVLPSWRENIKYPLSIIAVFLAGMAAVLVARYVRFHMAGGSLAGSDPDFAMFLDFVMAGAVAFFLRMIMRSDGAEFTMAKTAGIAVMIGIMHNFVHTMPAAFEMAFSPEWVEEVVYMTEPNSILFRGNSFVLGDPRTELPPYPAHWLEEDGLTGFDEIDPVG